VDEKELIDRCVARDEAAWSELLRRYQPVLRSLARQALHSIRRSARDHDVEDVVSGVLEALVGNDFRVLRSFRWQCSFETWLRVMVRTVCVRGVRRKEVDLEDLPSPEGEDLPVERLLSQETRGIVRRALDELPARERVVLSMFFIDGRTYQEISSQLGLAMGTVATIIARTRIKLRDYLVRKGILGEEA
jgi:RNA polymerase sigma-70 factor (ECF subfamily)